KKVHGGEDRLRSGCESSYAGVGAGSCAEPGAGPPRIRSLPLPDPETLPLPLTVAFLWSIPATGGTLTHAAAWRQQPIADDDDERRPALPCGQIQADGRARAGGPAGVDTHDRGNARAHARSRGGTEGCAAG